MGTILDFERIGILLNSFSVISGFCADMLDRNTLGSASILEASILSASWFTARRRATEGALPATGAAVPAPGCAARTIMFTAAISA